MRSRWRISKEAVTHLLEGFFGLSNRKSNSVRRIGPDLTIDGRQVDGQTELGAYHRRSPQDLVGFVKRGSVGGDSATAVGNREDDPQQDEQSQGGQDRDEEDAIPAANYRALAGRGLPDS